MKNHHTHITASAGDLYWRKSVPQSTGAKMLLRTIGGIAVIGHWYGVLGQHFVAWCPLPAGFEPSRAST